MKCFFDTCTEAVTHATKNKSFGVFFSDKKDHNQEVHIHECCEIFFCLEGGNSFLIDNKVYDISDGDLFIINQFEAHKVAPDKKDVFSRYIMQVHPSFLYSNSTSEINLADCFYSAGKITKVSLTQEETKELTALFDSLKTDYPYGDDMYKKLRATEILLKTSGLFATHNELPPIEFSHRTIQLAIDYINTNYSSDITLSDVAQSSFVSPTQLSRLFNRYCGTTVTKYIISKRITESKKLLSEGRSVTDTAYMCGFNDYANFIRTFKKTVGVPPGKYKSVSV